MTVTSGTNRLKQLMSANMGQRSNQGTSHSCLWISFALEIFMHI